VGKKRKEMKEGRKSKKKPSHVKRGKRREVGKRVFIS